TYSEEWPNVTQKGDVPADADAFKGEEGKFDKYFSAEPATGSYAARVVQLTQNSINRRPHVLRSQKSCGKP
ncbi:MAG: DUF3470 domain-containing protein, partial [Sphingomonadales bacterium]